LHFNIWKVPVFHITTGYSAINSLRTFSPVASSQTPSLAKRTLNSGLPERVDVAEKMDVWHVEASLRVTEIALVLYVRNVILEGLAFRNDF
jgi:hypothetical protein